MKTMSNSLNLFPLFMTLNLRFNPTKQGILKGTKNLPDIPPLTSHDFIEKELPYDFCLQKTEQILRKNINSLPKRKFAIGLSGGTDSSINTILLSQREDVSVKLF